MDTCFGSRTAHDFDMVVFESNGARTIDWKWGGKRNARDLHRRDVGGKKSAPKVQKRRTTRSSGPVRFISFSIHFAAFGLVQIHSFLFTVTLEFRAFELCFRFAMHRSSTGDVFAQNMNEARRWTLLSSLLVVLSLLDSTFGAGLSNFTAAATTVSWYLVECSKFLPSPQGHSFSPMFTFRLSGRAIRLRAPVRQRAPT